MLQAILQHIYKLDDLIGTISIISMILGIVSYIISMIEGKKNRKIYIIGIIIALIFGAVYFYLSGYTVVPDVTGKYYQDACSLLSYNRLTYNSINNPKDFRVAGQSVEAGEVVKKETLVELITENIIVPTNKTNFTENEPSIPSSESQSNQSQMSATEETQIAEPAITPENVPDITSQSVYTYTDMSSTMYATQSVNVRDLPGTEGQIIGQLASNQEVQITGQCNESGWYRLVYNEQTAYVSDHYISIENKSTQQTTQASSLSTIVEGQNPMEAVLLMSYINQYRATAGVNELVWNEELEQTAQALAEPSQSENQDALINLWFCCPIGRQCNGAKTAQKAVSDWIEGNQWVPSESDVLLSSDFTQMGGALYYYPNGNEYGYHYIWWVCLQ